MLRRQSSTTSSTVATKGIEFSDMNTIHTQFNAICQQRNLVVPKGIEKEFQKRLDLCKKKDNKSKLDLSKTQLTDELLQALLDVLDEYPVLNKLELNGNPITTKGIDAILTHLKAQLHLARTTALDRRLNMVFLAHVELTSTTSAKVPDATLSELHFLSECLVYLNTQARIRSVYLHLSLADPIPLHAINAFWSSLFGPPSQKVKDYFTKKVSEMLRANITAIPYAEVERHFMVCLTDNGDVAVLSERHLKELASQVPPEPEAVVEPEEEEDEEEESDHGLEEFDSDEEVAPINPIKPAPASPITSHSAASTSPLPSTTRQENTPPPKPSPVPSPAPSPVLIPTVPETDATVQDLLLRTEELEQEILRLHGIIGELSTALEQAQMDKEDEDGSVMPTPSGKVQEELKKVRAQNQRLQQKNKHLRSKNDTLLGLINTMEVARADVMIRSRVEANESQFMLENVMAGVLSEDDMVEF